MRKSRFILFLCLMFFNIAFCVPGMAAEANDTMKITAIDLGAENTGEAAMITDTNGSSLLLDTGDTHNSSIFEWLDFNGYKNSGFDMLVTHWHDDHAGNAAKIIARYSVGTVYIPPLDYIYSEDTDYYRYQRSYARKIVDAAMKKGTKIVYLRKGQEIRIGRVKGRVLYCCESPKSENSYSVQYINNQSAVIMFTGGGTRFLAGGDIQTEAENRILESGIDIKADIFKLSHHGINTSNSESFLKKIDPEYSYFTSNTATPYSMISDEVAESVSKAEKVSSVLSTRYHGTICFTCCNGNITVSSERNQR